MSYIGRGLQSGAFRQLDDISSGFDGSDTTHTMQVNSTNVTVGDVNQILLSLGGVIQKPGTDFTVSSSVLTFTTAPAANTSFFAILLGSDNGGTTTPTDGSVTTGKIVDDAVTAAKVASSGAFAIGAAGTASSLAGISFYKADNSIYTHDVSGTDSTAEFNTAFGVNALDAITTGDKHVAIGYNAGTAVTEAVGNVLIGEAAGAALTTGGSNTLIGRLAGDAFDTEANNIAIGVTALSGAVAGGEYNVGIGNYSLLALTSADYVTAVGNNAGTAITTGGKHVLVGHNAGSGLTTSAGSCVYIGTGAGSGSNNDAETNNIGIGEDTMGAAGNTINGAEYNVAIGNLSLDALTTGDQNVVIGYSAGTDMTTAGQNVLVGSYAGPNLTTGATQRNVMIGYAAGFYATDETNNIGIGALACGGAGTVNGGEYNTVIGNLGLDHLTSGDQNTAIGYNAGTAINTGQNNVMIGAGTCTTPTSKNNGTCIGTEANFGNNTGGAEIVIGQGCAGGGDNHFMFGTGNGNDRVYNVYTSNASWARVSDERYKENIKPNTDCGLDFINDLNSVTFTWKAKADIDPSLPDYDETKLEPTYDKKMYGLIAQEVKSAMDKHNITDFGGWDMIDKDADNKTDIQSISQEMFIHPLIKAVQELSAQVTTLKQELKTLKGG